MLLQFGQPRQAIHQTITLSMMVPLLSYLLYSPTLFCAAWLCLFAEALLVALSVVQWYDSSVKQPRAATAAHLALWSSSDSLLAAGGGGGGAAAELTPCRRHKARVNSGIEANQNMHAPVL